MLKVENISFEIGQNNILNQIDFEAKKGEMIALVGPNGAGKSTLLKLISKELKPSKGEIRIDNKNIEDINFNLLAQKRAVLTQSNYISLDYSVKEVVMMGRYPYQKTLLSHFDEEMVQKAMEICGVKQFEYKSITNLSGGEQQRVHFARAMAQLYNPEENQASKLLLLDEPLNNLDVKYQHQTLELAQDFAENGNVVIAVLHDLNLAAAYSDRIIMLHKGEIYSDGSPYHVFTETNLNHVFDYDVSVHLLSESLHPHIVFGKIHRKNNIKQIINQ